MPQKLNDDDPRVISLKAILPNFKRQPLHVREYFLKDIVNIFTALESAGFVLACADRVTEEMVDAAMKEHRGPHEKFVQRQIAAALRAAPKWGTP